MQSRVNNLQAFTLLQAVLFHAAELGALAEVPPAHPPLVRLGTRKWWQHLEAAVHMMDWNRGPAWLGKAKAVWIQARQAGRHTQQAGSGVEARIALGPGMWGGEQVGYSCCRLRGQSMPTPGQPCAGVHAGGDVNEL